MCPMIKILEQSGKLNYKKLNLLYLFKPLGGNYHKFREYLYHCIC